MKEIIGKWVLQEGMFKGLWFEFKEDGTYYSELPRLVKIKASGTYTISEQGLIDTDQTSHTMNMIGKFAGRFNIDGNSMKLHFGSVPGGPRPADLSEASIYLKED